MHMLDAPLHSVFLTPSLLWVNQTDVNIYVTGVADPKSALFWEAGSAQSQNLGDAEDQNGGPWTLTMAACGLNMEQRRVFIV